MAPASPRPSHRRRARLLAATSAGLVVLAGPLTLATTAQAASLAASASTRAAVAAALTTKTLSDVVTSDLNDYTVDGTLPSTTPMTVGVSIPGDTAGLEAYATSVTTPGSAHYGAALTPEQVEEDYGVSPATSQAVQHVLEAHGLTPAYVDRYGEYVELSGTAAQVEQTFGVTLEQITTTSTLKSGSHAGVHFLNTTGAVVPSAVGSVSGLTDLTDMTLADSQDTCQSTVGACIGTVTAQDLRAMYNTPGGAYVNATNAGDFGQGQKVAIFGEGNIADVVNALRLAESATTLNGDLSKPVLPQVPVREVLVNDPQNATTDTSGEDEFDLDSQSSTGMAPDLQELDFYFGNGLTDQSIQATFTAWVEDDNGPMIGNASFGGCESLEELSGGEATDNAILAEAVAEGRTMFVSSGDGGAGGCEVANAGVGMAPGVEDPADSPFATAVGGTVIYSNATATGAQAQPPTRNREYGWSESGGGYSLYNAMPADQKAVVAPAATSVPTPMPCVTPAGVTCREVPDVAAMSGDEVSNAYEVVLDTGGAETMEGVLGTSLASPLWAGMWSLIRADHTPTANACKTDASSSLADLGFAQPDLYNVASSPTLDAADFFDIGQTLANSNPSDNGPYPTLPMNTPGDPTGYDLPTGLGTPNITALATTLDCSTTPVNPALPPAQSQPIVVDSDTISSGTPGNTCPANGTATDPTGDEVGGADPGEDLTSGTVVGSPTGVSFTIHAAGAPVGGVDDAYTDLFGYNGVTYGVEVDPGGEAGYGDASSSTTPGTPAYRLFDIAVVQVETVPTFLGNLTGTTNTATGVFTISMPYATFDAEAAAVAGYQPLSQQSILSTVETLSGTEPAFASQTASDTMQFPCAVLLSSTAVTPPPSLPDSTVPAAMLGLGAVGGLAMVRRRRRRHAAA